MVTKSPPFFGRIRDRGELPSSRHAFFTLFAFSPITPNINAVSISLRLLLTITGLGGLSLRLSPLPASYGRTDGGSAGGGRGPRDGGFGSGNVVAQGKFEPARRPVPLMAPPVTGSPESPCRRVRRHPGDYCGSVKPRVKLIVGGVPTNLVEGGHDRRRASAADARMQSRPPPTPNKAETNDNRSQLKTAAGPWHLDLARRANELGNAKFDVEIASKRPSTVATGLGNRLEEES